MQYILIAIVAFMLIGGGMYYSYTAKPASVAPENMERATDEKAMKENSHTMDDGSMMSDEESEMMKNTQGSTTPVDAMMSSGSYEAYAPEKIARAAEGSVVLFFRASWCPTCQGADTDIRTNAKNIPKGVTILDVNYDNSQELKKKYSVTYQHTYVQIDASGNQIAKWSGSRTLTELLAQVKS